MKKKILWVTLLALMCAQVQAKPTSTATQPQLPTPPNPSAAMEPAAPATMDPIKPVGTNQPTTQTPSSEPVTEQPAAIVNCDYKIPASTKTIDISLILNWSEKATNQAFDFNPDTIDAQMAKLKSCFTDQGWTGFDSALKKSGNIDAIKNEKLNVSSQFDGQSQVTEAKENQWKILLPLQVVYQNDKEKVTQLLNVNLTVGRKINGDLGIIQMIATPRTPVKPEPTASVNTDDTKTSTSPTTPGKVTTSPVPTPTEQSGQPAK